MLSICITCLNDNEELDGTIQSILDTAGDRPEIIVIDDASKEPVVLRHKCVIRRRNPERVGVAGSRDLAVQIATREHVLLIDSHMRFEPGWYDNFLAKAHPDTAWCATCLGLSKQNMDMKRSYGEYSGARLVLFEPPPVPDRTGTIFEGKWAQRNQKDGSDVQCFMGACYFIPRQHYLRVKGLRALKQWGSDEPYLSTKLWLAGVPIKYAKDIRIGHQFRKSTEVPYTNTIWCLIYNKLRAFQELFGHDTYKFIRTQFPESAPLHKAIKQIMQDSREISMASDYYRGIFKEDVEQMCERFAIRHPLSYANVSNTGSAPGLCVAATRPGRPRVRFGSDLGPVSELVGQGV